jgi:hypothetical protein
MYPPYAPFCIDLCGAPARNSEVTDWEWTSDNDKPSGVGGHQQTTALNTTETYGRFGRSEFEEVSPLRVAGKRPPGSFSERVVEASLAG